MKTGIYLSYIGLGANLLHLSYCHQIAKKHGPVTIITLCKNLKEALADDLDTPRALKVLRDLDKIAGKRLRDNNNLGPVSGMYSIFECVLGLFSN